MAQSARQIAQRYAWSGIREEFAALVRRTVEPSAGSRPERCPRLELQREPPRPRATRWRSDISRFSTRSHAYWSST